MNFNGILLLSTIMEMLFFFSIFLAAVVLWINVRKKRAARLKDSNTPRERLSSVIDEHRRS